MPQILSGQSRQHGSQQACAPSVKSTVEAPECSSKVGRRSGPTVSDHLISVIARRTRQMQLPQCSARVRTKKRVRPPSPWQSLQDNTQRESSCQTPGYPTSTTVATEAD